VGRHVLDLLKGLIDHGWDTHLIYSPLRMSMDFQQAIEPRTGLTAVSLPIRRSIHPEDVIALREVVHYVRRCGPFDLIHGHSSKGGALARLAGRICGVPSVYTPNALVTMNPELGHIKSRVYRVAERCLGRMGDLFIAVSDAERHHAISLGVPASSIAVVPNGIAPPLLRDRQTVRAEFGIDADAPVVGFVGRLSCQKAPQVLIRAFAECVAGHPHAVLAIVGEGPLQEELEQLAHELGVSRHIRWLGARNGQQAMPAFDLLVLSSNYEGMPYVLLEAAHAGLPIVATRVSGASTVVRDNENGFLVAPGDTGAIARAMDALLSDSDLRARFSAASLARVREWTRDRMVRETVKLYAGVAGNRRRAEARRPISQVLMQSAFGR
jgi:glycosyltransferase involved in cell wall biosynthesis